MAALQVATEQVRQPIPGKESILRCMEITTTPESAHYFNEALTERLTEARLLKQAEGLLEEIKQFVVDVERQTESMGKPWSGDLRESTPFQNFQRHLLEEIQSEPSSEEIVFDYAISEDTSTFIRGYSTDGVPLDEDALAVMDRYLAAWLADNDMLSQDGVIYEVTPKGEIKLDQKGQPIKADVEKLKQKLHDKSSGFEAFVRSLGVTTSLREQPFPPKGPEVEPEVPSAPTA